MDIIEAYESMTFDINTDSSYLENQQDAYRAVQRYKKGIISLDELCKLVDDVCPPNACWCQKSCAECDLKNIPEKDRCKMCWERCLSLK